MFFFPLNSSSAAHSPPLEAAREEKRGAVELIAQIFFFVSSLTAGGPNVAHVWRRGQKEGNKKEGRKEGRLRLNLGSTLSSDVARSLLPKKKKKTAALYHTKGLDRPV